MPFKKGNKLAKGQGRKGYEYEDEQLKKMRRILDKDLKMVERIQENDEISETDEKKLTILNTRIKTYTDKLHVSRTATDITTKGEVIKMTPEVLAIARKYEEELKKTL